MSLAGRLEDLALADIFQILSIGRKTGTLTIRGSKGTALIVFKNGMIVRGETDDLEKSLADTMVDAGLIKDTVFHLAAEVKKKLPSTSMAEILLDLESVNKNILEQVTRKRIEAVIYRLLYWEDGDFQFEPDDLDIDGKTCLTDLGWELGKGLSPNICSWRVPAYTMNLHSHPLLLQKNFHWRSPEQKKRGVAGTMTGDPRRSNGRTYPH